MTHSFAIKECFVVNYLLENYSYFGKRLHLRNHSLWFSVDSTEVYGSFYNFKHCRETAVGITSKKYVQEDSI